MSLGLFTKGLFGSGAGGGQTVKVQNIVGVVTQPRIVGVVAQVQIVGIVREE
jgi:hypothetical protein